jgi:hypothetical protein
MTFTPLSQKDPRWASKKLGTGTIKDRGCTVTALAMLAGTTPDKIVDEAGFTDSGAIYWQTLKSLRFIWRGYTYEDDKVLEAIKIYGGCLVEVSSPNAPGGKHWVLAIGNGRILDPIDGKEKPFSTYSPTGYCVLEPLQIEPDPNYKGLYDLARVARDAWWNAGVRVVGELLGESVSDDAGAENYLPKKLDKVIEEYKKLKVKEKELNDKITSLNATIKNLTEGSLFKEKEAIKKIIEGVRDFLRLIGV